MTPEHAQPRVGHARPPARSELSSARPLPRGRWAGVLVVGTGLFELLQQTLLATRNPNLVPALILIGALAVPAAFVAFVWGRRLPYDVPGGVLAAIAVTGGVIGIVVAGTLEYATVRRMGTLPLLAVGFIEETAKLIVLALILLWGRVLGA